MMSTFLKMLGSMLAGFLAGIPVAIALTMLLSGAGEGILWYIPNMILPVSSFASGTVAGYLLSNFRYNNKKAHITRLISSSPGFWGSILFLILDRNTIDTGFFAIIWTLSSWIGSFLGWASHSLFIRHWRPKLLFQKQ